MSEIPASNPPPKRFIFNQPSWSNPQQIGTADDFFHRSNQTYVDIAADAERKRKERKAKKQHSQIPGEGRELKRRRISDDSEEKNISSGSEETNQVVEQKLEVDSIVALSNHISPSPGNSTSSPNSLSKRYEDTIACKVDKKLPRQLDIIDLEDEEELPKTEQKRKGDEDDDIEVTQVKISIPPDEDDFPVSDDEFAELARNAREKARRKRLEEDLASAAPDSLPSAVEDGYLQRSQSHQPTPPPPNPEPVVQILITSRIANTEPLIVCRQVSQRLKDVRVTWCQRQGFTPDFIPKVFLTWKGKRLFDVTSCKSLGIAVGSDGEILKGQKDIMNDEGAQIHMEAMTNELFEEYQKAKRRGMDEEDEDEAAVWGSTPVEQKQEVQVKIVLKAKGFEDFKLIVKLTTLISRIVNAFRSDKKIASDKEVFLLFDGDRLAPEDNVGDVGFSDMDYIDVYVK